MNTIHDILKMYCGASVALYGLGTETERFLDEYRNRVSILALLDGFRDSGNLYGFPILPIQDAINKGVNLIIVIARPGSCKAITKRIGDICRKSSVALYDIRGKDLLAQNIIKYDFSGLSGTTKETLIKKINASEIISFDLFDTLIMRKAYTYTDIFDLVDLKLRHIGIVIPDFAERRLSAEKVLSKNGAPTLEMIYETLLQQLGGSFFSADELAVIEWEIDYNTMLPRREVCEIYKSVLSSGKKVIITTDTYYRRERIKELILRFGLDGFDNVFISCECGTSKSLKLYDIVIANYKNKVILHIGDDETADILETGKREIDSYRIYSGSRLFDELGGLGIENQMNTLSDRLKCGLFISQIFNTPFQFERENCNVSVSNAHNIGYLFCGPMITDFIFWLNEQIKKYNFKQILFCARDGYLIGRLYRMIDTSTRSIYFLTSRTASIRAGMESDEDIQYVDSMKYFGSIEKSSKKRFGIVLSDKDENKRKQLILQKSELQKANYRKYIKKLEISDEKTAMFDFVAKGTTQMFLERVFNKKFKGFYFLQLEREFMADKGLDIKPFYSEEEKEDSAIYENYYILETILTSPYPQTDEFDDEGNPKFADEFRNESNILCFEKIQNGILEYFEDYLKLLPVETRSENKKLDELFLDLINHVEVVDKNFSSLKVEDPFFGRSTDIADILW